MSLEKESKQQLQLAWDYRNTSQYQKASQILTHLLDSCAATDHLLLGRIYHVFRQMAFDQHNYTDAIQFGKETIHQYTKADDSQLLAHAIRHQGDTFVKEKNFGMAKEHYENAIELYKKSADTTTLDYANAIRAYAIACEKSYDYKTALKQWRKAKTLYASHGLKEGEYEAMAAITQLRDKQP